jgi:flagellum-specific ATP synthase
VVEPALTTPAENLSSPTLSELVTKLEELQTRQPLVEPVGRIIEAAASGYKVQGLSQFISLGSLVRVECRERPLLAEVVRVEETIAIVRPYDSHVTVNLATQVVPAGQFVIRPCKAWKGRMINALANEIDGGSSLPLGALAVNVQGSPFNPMMRKVAKGHVKTGIKIIDIFTPICNGQRIGIFAGSGVGKSTVLSMLGRAKGFDTVVAILVGERGREVREFAESALGQDRHRLISVVSTSDESPMMRRLAPQTGMRIAEYFRECGENVLLIVDSITRYAHACREVALSAGEAPVARGFPPSVFTSLPQLLERAGPGLEGSGSITGVFSVLVDGDDHNDPIADSIRGILDGHIVLKRGIAEQGRYPAMDPLASISRLAELSWTPDQKKLVQLLRTLIARYEDSRDLRAMGGYQAGADFELDRALVIIPKLYQAMTQSSPLAHHIDPFAELANELADLKQS